MENYMMDHDANPVAHFRVRDFPIGTRYKTRGKNPKLCTVEDIHKTYDSKGRLVKTSYIASHEFCGQIIREKDVAKTTIAMGFVSVPGDYWEKESKK